MAKGVPVCWLVFMDVMMAASAAPVELQDGVSLLQINNTMDEDYGELSSWGLTFPVFKKRLEEVEKLPSVPQLLTAAIFSAWMYFLGDWPQEGWKGYQLQGTYSHTGDDVALFKNDLDQCVLGFKGTETLLQWTSNLNHWSTEGMKIGEVTAYKCGLGEGRKFRDQEVHRGFWDDTKDFLMQLVTGMEPTRTALEDIVVVGEKIFGGPKEEIANTIKMTDINTCTSLDVVGHSKGGSMASIYAACANGYFFGRSWKHVDKLYTFGAPAIAIHAPSPEVAGSGSNGAVFDGERVFNMDKQGHYDAVAGITTWGGSRRRRMVHSNYMHPKISTLALTGERGVYEYQADVPATWSMPQFDHSTMKIRLHLIDEYLKRLIELASV